MFVISKSGTFRSSNSLILMNQHQHTPTTLQRAQETHFQLIGLEDLPKESKLVGLISEQKEMS
jgi:hypothetical protein